uniref:Fibrillin-1-like n=1 Tax=Phallusia mammillata TaxID=59560 RepID=A0A6F9DDF5_9ASCI|nr:fibrillin-1-like [Phallusia mammillata]
MDPMLTVFALLLVFGVNHCFGQWGTGTSSEIPCTIKVNCSWSEWAPLSGFSCSATCGNGTLLETRRHKVFAQCGGEHCSGPSSRTVTCNKRCCLQNCVWAPWSPYSCSVTCGVGRSHRSRQKLVLESCGGRCIGPSEQFSVCNNKSACCPKDCKWSSWTHYSLCSVSCGNGTMRRTRFRRNEAVCGGTNCTGPEIETDTCNHGCCPVDCQTGSWGEFGPCTQTCGGGYQSRNRSVTVKAKCGGDCLPEKYQACATQDCLQKCLWSNWSKCSVTCGNGTQTRKQSSYPSNCTKAEKATENKACFTSCCPIDCQWDSWSKWSKCSTTCGGGYQLRRRNITAIASCNGSSCHGESWENRTCNSNLCRDRKANPELLKSSGKPNKTVAVIVPVVVIAVVAFALLAVLVRVLCYC